MQGANPRTKAGAASNNTSAVYNLPWLNSFRADPLDKIASIIQKTEEDNHKSHSGFQHQILVLIQNVQLLTAHPA